MSGEDDVKNGEIEGHPVLNVLSKNGGRGGGTKRPSDEDAGAGRRERDEVCKADHSALGTARELEITTSAAVLATAPSADETVRRAASPEGS